LYQITKHIAKVLGERIFTALLTVTNENGLIRICNLVATKAHSQFEHPLKQMRQSLELYGHSPVQLFFTDNLADKAFLESSFPSLLQDVIPVEKYGDLEPFKIPPDVQICVRSEETAINTALATILNHLPLGETDSNVVIGFDCEWNIDISEHGRVERGEIAVIQIAYADRVLILQVCELK
jgi:hypothetical protein